MNAGKIFHRRTKLVSRRHGNNTGGIFELCDQAGVVRRGENSEDVVDPVRETGSAITTKYRAAFLRGD